MRKRVMKPRTALLAVIATAGLVAGCGGSSPEEEATEAAERFLDAMSTGDAGVCGDVTVDGVDVLVDVAYAATQELTDGPSNCETALSGIADADAVAFADVASVEVDGDLARAETDEGLELRMEQSGDGTWELDGLSG